MEAIRQDVQQESADEFADLDAHHLVLAPAAVSIMLPAEADVGLVEIEQATVGDRDAMGVPRQVAQYLLGTGEYLFGINNPLGCAQRRDSAGEFLGSFQVGEIAEKLQFACLECRHQAFKEQAPEQARQHANRKKESGPGCDPTPAVQRDAATWNNAVQVRMVLQVLTPGVQHGQDSDFRTEVPAISGNRDQRLRGSLK